MILKELGKQYIEAATQLKARARQLEAAPNTRQAAAVHARIRELRAVAVAMKKYGRYLQSYYERQGGKHAL